MQFIYPGVFHKKEDGTYEGYLPDLEGCVAKGDDINDVLEEAHAAMTDWIAIELEEDQPFLPPVSDESDIELKDGEFIRQVCVIWRMREGWDE